MKRALQVIVAISAQEGLAEANIKRELDAIDPEKVNRLQLIGLTIEDNRGDTIRFSVFLLNAPFTSFPVLEESAWLAQARV
jgi:hypothetical protein